MSIKYLTDIRASDTPLVGGKAARLGELMAAGHQVPTGFAVLAGSAISDEELLTAYEELELENVAVRSSGIGEDGKDKSWAGQFATLLHVTQSELCQAVQTCIASAQSARTRAYASGESFDLAVLVQQMIHSEIAGVAFSANPVTGNRNELVIESVYGLGELLVQGTATPDNYLLTKQGNLLDQDIATKLTFLTYEQGATIEAAVPPHKQNNPSLKPRQLKELARTVTAIEDHYGYPVDVEWAYGTTGQLYILQARPITTL
ncbi:MAG TPA: PEP/pyruvate-binding domain-containing protein [Candidatus Saccharimonadales bacterium]|nr:PEP/pyruvate-binding domain-containing protein [Candidatus Saccharimonadales bacterium]